MNMHRVMILLSGCGPLDGSDPFESVFCHYWLEKLGCEVIYGAPSGNFFQTVDHLTGTGRTSPTRKILVESSRLSRGKIFPLREVSPRLVQGIVVPGGQGVSKNYFSINKNKLPVLKPEVARFLKAHHESRGTILGLSLAEFAVKFAIPKSADSPSLLELKPGQFISNEELGVILAPGSMLTSSSSTLFAELEMVIKEFINMMMRRFNL